MLSTTNQALGAAKWLAGTGVANTSHDDRLMRVCQFWDPQNTRDVAPSSCPLAATPCTLLAAAARWRPPQSICASLAGAVRSHAPD